MSRKLCFITNSTDLSLITFSDEETYSFDYESHKNLEKLNVEHFIAEEFLDDSERFHIFDKVKEFRDWYDNPLLPKFELNNINIFSLLDGMEFHELLMQKLILFFTVKKIMEIKNPTSIECPSEMIELVKLVDCKNHVDIKLNSDYQNNKLFWDTINVKKNIAGIPFSIKIARTKYNKLKNLLDKIVGITYRLYFDLKNKDKKTIILLEMYPPIYKELIQNLREKDHNIIIINRRRPVTLEKESIKILKSSNCKLISKKDLFGEDDLKKISIFTNNYLQKINEIWNDDQKFNQVFRIDNITFWSIIKKELKEVFKRRIGEYVELIFFVNKIYEKINVKKILTLYETGETERAFLKNKNTRIESYLLEHGFNLLFEETKRFGMINSYDKFTDKIVVWSNFQKQFLIKNYGIGKDRILAIGSPRHDILTKKMKPTRNNEQLTILIAPTPITQLQGFDTTESHKRFENSIKQLCSILEKHHTNLVFKIHPSQSFHNDEIKKIIETYSKNSSIYLLNPVTELIESSDLVITITPEGWCPSTIILESMILGKPVLNINLDDRNYDFEYIRQKAAIAVSHDSIEKVVLQLINNSSFRDEISRNAISFTKKFLVNYGKSSNILSEVLKTQSD